MHREQLLTWAKDDLLLAYEALGLTLHWEEHITVHWVHDARGELHAVGLRWEHLSARAYYYAATRAAALEEALSLLPPEGNCTVCAPDTEAHRPLLALGAVRQPDEVFYQWGGGTPPAAAREVARLSAEEAVAAGLGEPWDWPTILGKGAAAHPIHCIIEQGRVIAVAAAGCVTPFTEEVRGVYVEPEWRRQGLGRDVVASATRGILARGRQPVYMHSADNAGSRRVAESVGYARRGAFLRLACGEAKDRLGIADGE